MRCDNNTRRGHILAAFPTVHLSKIGVASHKVLLCVGYAQTHHPIEPVGLVKQDGHDLDDV